MKIYLKISTALSFILVLSCKKNIATINTSGVSAYSKTNTLQADSILGRQLVISLPTGDRTYPTSQALLWMPLTYDKKKSKTYPLIFNLYGQGQVGTDLNKLLKGNTMSEYIADGFDATALNPVDGKKYSFFVCSPQCPVTWGWSAPHVNKMLTQLKNTYPIDTTRIYITGFSAGGWGLWSCMTDNDNLTKQFAAIVPISSASADHPDKFGNIGKYSIACINICGDQDAFYTNAVNYTNMINSYNPPIRAKLNTLHSVGHAGWKYAYDSTWKTIDSINVYEWMIQYKRK